MKFCLFWNYSGNSFRNRGKQFHGGLVHPLMCSWNPQNFSISNFFTTKAAVTPHPMKDIQKEGLKENKWSVSSQPSRKRLPSLLLGYPVVPKKDLLINREHCFYRPRYFTFKRSTVCPNGKFTNRPLKSKILNHSGIWKNIENEIENHFCKSTIIVNNIC